MSRCDPEERPSISPLWMLSSDAPGQIASGLVEMMASFDEKAQSQYTVAGACLGLQLEDRLTELDVKVTGRPCQTDPCGHRDRPGRSLCRPFWSF